MRLPAKTRGSPGSPFFFDVCDILYGNRATRNEIDFWSGYVSSYNNLLISPLAFHTGLMSHYSFLYFAKVGAAYNAVIIIHNKNIAVFFKMLLMVLFNSFLIISPYLIETNIHYQNLLMIKLICFQNLWNKHKITSLLQLMI